MQRIDGAYLYEIGATLRPVLVMPEHETPLFELFFALSPVRDSIAAFVYSSVFSGSLKTVLIPAGALLAEINEMVPEPGSETDWTSKIPAWQVTGIKNAFRKFEAVLLAELQTFALYHVAPKGGLDTSCLTDRGETLFSNSLAGKVPEAIEDVVTGARCMAFGLWTAMGFHFHRANEAVLRRYFASVIGAANQPKHLTIGSMVSCMTQNNVGDVNIRAALDNIRVFHRNPIAHPDHQIDNEEEALSLYAAIRAASGYMLDKLSYITLPPIVPPPDPLQLTP